MKTPACCITVFFFLTLEIGFSQTLQMVKDINTVTSGGSFPRDFTPTTDFLYFIANDGTDGQKIFKTSDGTPGGTVMLGPSVNTFFSLRELTALNDQLYFVCNDGVNGPELWTSDGTTAGTQLLFDVRAGSVGSEPRALTVANNKLFFLARDEISRWGLYVTDGTPGSLIRLKDFAEVFNGLTEFAVMDNRIFFRSDDGSGTGSGFWCSDGTPAGTTLLSNAMNPGSIPCNYVVWNNKLYFSASDDRGAELWTTDGSPAGTQRVCDLNGVNSSNPQSLVVFDDRIFFTALESAYGLELWATDGTEAGTHLVKDIVPGTEGSQPVGPVVFNGNLFFSAVMATQLWTSDGTEAGTVQLPTAEFLGRYAGAYLNKMYFIQDGVANGILFESDGTAGGFRRPQCRVHLGRPGSAERTEYIPPAAG